ncbi:MAG: hypothetical protein KJN62_09230, partial [Deltaproteobacteria bacterium]|nr:hypothetical protein [Deltaproteobacteria bacterium]
MRLREYSIDSCRDRLVAKIEKLIKEMQLIKFEDALGAAIRPGRANTLHPKTCGDSLLIDFESKFFAVADSPERNPSASRAFLQKLHAALVPHLLCLEHFDPPEKTVENVSERIVNKTNSIIESIEYNNSTTFTGLIIMHIQGVDKVLLLHSGDSLFYHCRLDGPSVERVSE